jgi:threonine/homoserine/homoserine lactone efflux protein
MSLETFTAALIFAAVMGFTPGPNNVMLASSGARFGVGRSLPHMIGVTVGFPVMLLLVGLGLASILLASPMLQLAMKMISCAYLLWLALKIGRSAFALDDSGSAKPLTFTQAAAFQWINPKAWMMAVSAISAYTAGTGSRLYWQVTIIALITLAVTLASTWTWTAFGAGIRRWLRSPRALRHFNLAMALMLVASTLPILLEIAASLKKA